MSDTQFFTNADGNTLLDRFKQLLTKNNFNHFDALSGFVRASGYFQLRSFLSRMQHVRILIGINADEYILKAIHQGQLYLGASVEAKTAYSNFLVHDINTSAYSASVEEGIRTMAQDIAAGILEVRICTQRSVHAKVYIMYPDGFSTDTTGGYMNVATITGSSNLTANGLGALADKQYEFNVQLNDEGQVHFALNEFETLWASASDCVVAPADFRTVVQRTYIDHDASPYELYIKLLQEYFGERVLRSEEAAPYSLPDGFTDYAYQRDAVMEGYTKLRKYNGFFLADVVGLGKTVIATQIARQFCYDNGYDRTRILVVYPPAVEWNWKDTFKAFGIDPYTRFISNGSLQKLVEQSDHNYWDIGDYDLIIVDEAHKFRSNATKAFEYLQDICKYPRINQGGILGDRKYVILVSATPMNNTPADLFNELQLFEDPRNCSLDNAPNLTTTFSQLDAEFRRCKRVANGSDALKVQMENLRATVIKPLTVRRTRTDIQKMPRYADEIVFPTVEPPRKIEYELSDRIADFFEQTMNYLTTQLTYARYRAIEFLVPEKKVLYDQAEMVTRSLVSIRKNGLVKRLESSFHAFKISLEHFRTANQNMVEMFAHDKIFILPDLDYNLLKEGGYSDAQIEAKMDLKAVSNPKNAVFKRADFEPGFKELLEADQELLDKLCDWWETVTEADDTKYDRFEDKLQHELFDTTLNPAGKVVIFTESKDTMEYLQGRLHRDDVLAISAGNSRQERETIGANFDANWSEESKDDYHILITTEVLAEGVNLHRANVIVNYDTPWNATKLMQRIGRLNRVGGKSKRIYNYVFYPSRQGNKEIHLAEIVTNKLTTIITLYGDDNQFFSTTEPVERNVDKLFDEAIRYDAGELDEEIPFYEFIRKFYLTNRSEYDRIAQLPLRSRTGRRTREVNGVTLHDETLVFIKTSARKVFYRYFKGHVEPLTTIQTLRFFEALPEEPTVPRGVQHHEAVQKVLDYFHHETEDDRSTTATPVRNMGGQVTSATKLIQLFNDDEDIQHLLPLVNSGTIYNLVATLQRLYKSLKDGTKGADAVKKEVHSLAQKYASYYATTIVRPLESSADVILSETFD